MASINDLATAATALVTSARAAPHSSLPDPAQIDDRGSSDPAVARGALVVLEGLDRSGKTTQVKLLEQRFVELGRKVKVVRFPGMYCTLHASMYILDSANTGATGGSEAAVQPTK
jgi:dTMP kinase